MCGSTQGGGGSVLQTEDLILDIIYASKLQTCAFCGFNWLDPGAGGKNGNLSVCVGHGPQTRFERFALNHLSKCVILPVPSGFRHVHDILAELIQLSVCT